MKPSDKKSFLKIRAASPDESRTGIYRVLHRCRPLSAGCSRTVRSILVLDVVVVVRRDGGDIPLVQPEPRIGNRAMVLYSLRLKPDPLENVFWDFVTSIH